MEHRPIIAGKLAAPEIQGSPEVQAIVAGRLLIAGCVGLCVALAAAYLATRELRFQSKVQLLVESGELQLFREEPVVVPSLIPPSVMETQVRLLGSRGMARAVVENLGLAADPEFTAPGLTERLRAALGFGQDGSGAESGAKRNRAVAGFMARLSVESLGLSSVVEVGFASTDPRKAAVIANETARVYQEWLDEAASARARGTSAWVLERAQSVGTHARVISEATASVFATGVRAALVLPAAAVAGLMLGVALAILSHLARPAARGPEQVATLVGAEHLASLPPVPGGDPGSAVLGGADTAFARSLDRVAAALHEWRRARPMVLGVAAIAPGAGATTVATGLAQLLALRGHRVMLVDCNPADPAVTRRFGMLDMTGLTDVLEGAGYEEVAVGGDLHSGLDVLPIGTAGRVGASVLQGPAATALAARLQGSYDVSVVDLPALTVSPEVRAAGPILDGLVLVIDAAPVPHRRLRDALRLAGGTRNRLVGFVLNRSE